MQRNIHTQIFSRYPTPVGIRKYAPPSPRARQPYFAWLSMRAGLREMPRREDTRSLKECDAWAASTDSRKLRFAGGMAGMIRGVGFAPLIFICSNSYSTTTEGQELNDTDLLGAMPFHCNKYTSAS